jgi:Caspase domain
MFPQPAGAITIRKAATPMDRKALLIGCPGKQNYLPGVARDLANYDRFLRSPLGGAWYSSEIISLDDPPASTVRAAIQNLKSADYSFVLFSGHGYVTSNRRSTIVGLRDDKEMDSDELRTGAAKHTLLLDCCRQVAKPMLAEDALAKMDSMTAARSLSTSACRRYYDQAISECPSALIVAHSCDIDEVANDDPTRGGYYSYSLIDVAEDWAERYASGEDRGDGR